MQSQTLSEDSRRLGWPSKAKSMSTMVRVCVYVTHLFSWDLSFKSYLDVSTVEPLINKLLRKQFLGPMVSAIERGSKLHYAA